jgi:hypothetical protein
MSDAFGTRRESGFATFSGRITPTTACSFYVDVIYKKLDGALLFSSPVETFHLTPILQ